MKSEDCIKGMVTRGLRVRAIMRIVKTKASLNGGDDEKLQLSNPRYSSNSR
ncbi:hypothetical protein FH972_027177 [Carpinus fangiana]|uniref:Uncharacterized protein n=1 Tax=Carpinus fangiana TaxID=176857 RepID=A0A5N6L8N8_9ROSI|nr:hypothetical protein FH972_027177 [Carpinus fangiana]